MEYIKVKGIEQPISRMIMGTAWFGIGADVREEIFKMLDLYVEVGGNVIDTGRFYGAGRAELILKEWLDSRDNREQLIIMDKACHPIITEDGAHHPEYWRVKPDLITDDLHSSLLRTGCDHFDLYLMHRDDPDVPVELIMDRLEAHRKEGLITAYGVSNWELSRVEDAVNYCNKKGYQGLSVNNPSYSLATVKKTRWPGCVYADDAYAQWHNGKDVTLFSWAAQAHGFFADIYDENAPQDIKDAFFSDENFEKLRRCQVLAKKYQVDSINIALAYVLCQPFKPAAIIGSRSRKEFDSCIQTLDLKLTDKELAYLSLQADSAEEAAS
ncbi:aldo/keto reductase [Enterococcus sp. HY326]|uniref:aldo/keto reductase n=1 Tax=Enterococcus sp. HY326 TaxID=2971265 RepID=UPI0022409C3E|nr:aldo/keto reductase [Enterococcus sp. HY326]